MAIAEQSQPLRVGLCGLGNVGQGLLELLILNAEQIESQAGRPIQITQIASRTPKPHLNLGEARFSTDIDALIAANDVDVVVELIGGERRAKDLSLACLELGKPLVTGNKALLALHGAQLFDLARRNGVSIGIEAAVAGGIPIINALMSGLAGNQIESVVGIINGTCNYILSAMTQERADFAATLATAQALGYAEADPSFDIGGVDAAHKIAIVAGLVFGAPVDFADVYVEGIEGIAAEDIEYATQLGYRIKHLGIARRRGAAIEVRAHPALVPEAELLAGVHGVSNALVVYDNAVGQSVYSGPGAGGVPTAASVVADLIRLARGSVHQITREDDRSAQVLDIGAAQSAFYVRIPVLDQPGVLAELARLFGAQGISIESVIQREQAVRSQSDQAWVPIVLVTNRVTEAALRTALETIAAQPAVVGELITIRVESLVGR